MITSSILGHSGQLGNQLFQYAVLTGISKLKGYEIKLLSDIPSGNVFDVKSGTNLQYSLSLNECFDIPEEFIESKDAIINRVVQESHYHFDEKILECEDGTALWGYFETDKYFSHAEDDLRKKLKFKKEILNISTKRISEIKGEKPLVSIHVRRGQDRPGIQDYHPFTPLEFYTEAIKEFPDHDFIIFTDDFEWCKAYLPEIKIFEWETSYKRPDFIDLCSMSMCDHHIIANSTFSWWGAWLNPSETKKVIAPSVWFGSGKVESNGEKFNITDNIPNNWKRI